ncbi:Pimeloyl-ACP methyl ester carboxylesterase [Hymenobacter daecheongensis DSM 21074]|uniref:Pimeloyl-ACP methyl ester carboxylesterase n=1 Tax=Hymenobacter daecheongensis DSM 21074 TaxID=1121955 RepID=A0A1M6GXK9_9BACT|nr:alpha/beta fold hydrolase [Hymenobacter daecheongensis]SHJ14662.1 Pimeloyl-ACP methyl ester carboxylesterase [Hymenobacter daecheongensis DSM 21074]
MNLHHVRRGTGRPLLLVHGIGGSWRSWNTVIDALAAERDVVAIDLPGHGATPPLPGENSIGTFADALTAFLTQHDLLGIDAVGSSMGARLVLELARRGGVLGAVVSLDPGGFWQGWEIPFFYHSVAVSEKLVKALQPVMPALAGSAVGRTVLLPQFSARPWAVDSAQAVEEMRTFGTTPVFEELLDRLAHGEVQKPAPKGSIREPLVIGWGRQDRVCLPGQAKLALKKFPDARLYWFENCGHFPQWDQPEEATRLILAATGRHAFTDADIARREPRKAAAPTVPKAAVIGVALAVLAGGIWSLAARRHRPRGA